MHESTPSTARDQRDAITIPPTAHPDLLSDSFSDGWSNRGPNITAEPHPQLHDVRAPLTRRTGGMPDSEWLG